MSDTASVHLHRVFSAPPARVYRAFLSPAAWAKWLPPHGFTGEVQQLDAQVGGTYHMRFTNLGTGHSHGFGGEFLELVPERRLRYTARFDDATLPGQMQTTVTLAKVSVGTDVRIVQEGIPSMIPIEACYLGWQQSLQLLALLIEPDIPD